ncbi:helix-turn-helix transcriptional regulator [Kineosporia rhizophila]|uniref:winged helix-turn-helix transcriptional regulator n=1 Tax=Kineosporia TaxID=49184 RepID=UPI000A807280|nr:helix-turn-helix domain-containing protein [Kineosporia sp. NBRC 101677]MCE0537559.1 helix-turn-helix transcriptional regulator [Kineosporia rhizophila]GLY18936.1 HxlR family transcriptional regulator [Kineosporia sp. NBRC 101677]
MQTSQPGTWPEASGTCPVGPVVDVVLSRWTTPILWTLNFRGRQRFLELQQGIPGISPKVLTDSLRRLERDGLVSRAYHREVPPRVEYEITELGATLAPLFAHLATWGTEHLGAVEQARLAYDAS